MKDSSKNWAMLRLSHKKPKLVDIQKTDTGRSWNKSKVKLSKVM